MLASRVTRQVRTQSPVMNSAPSSSSWLLWLRNALILAVVAVGAFWGVAELLTPPVAATGSAPRLPKTQLDDIRRAAQAVDAAWADGLRLAQASGSGLMQWLLAPGQRHGPRRALPACC